MLYVNNDESLTENSKALEISLVSRIRKSSKPYTVARFENTINNHVYQLSMIKKDAFYESCHINKCGYVRIVNEDAQYIEVYIMLNDVLTHKVVKNCPMSADAQLIRSISYDDVNKTFTFLYDTGCGEHTCYISDINMDNFELVDKDSKYIKNILWYHGSINISMFSEGAIIQFDNEPFQNENHYENEYEIYYNEKNAYDEDDGNDDGKEKENIFLHNYDDYSIEEGYETDLT